MCATWVRMCIRAVSINNVCTFYPRRGQTRTHTHRHTHPPSPHSPLSVLSLSLLTPLPSLRKSSGRLKKEKNFSKRLFLCDQGGGDACMTVAVTIKPCPSAGCVVQPAHFKRSVCPLILVSLSLSFYLPNLSLHLSLCLSLSLYREIG